jgi:hypothetical protein
LIIGFIERLRLVITSKCKILGNLHTLQSDGTSDFLWEVADCFLTAVGQGDTPFGGPALSSSVRAADLKCKLLRKFSLIPFGRILSMGTGPGTFLVSVSVL